ncbi:hypothetical protein L1987_07764 [Smallanthus sonchifolius]|uniref:Uncharacterized protein n=1 Tax=Smallanthus sonchifolius TaxID=185202 RepID=A0ACB9JJ84_9ASTR|nr:hypothetical protein L1987_07764 [Smallanthus sonchifolius]
MLNDKACLMISPISVISNRDTVVVSYLLIFFDKTGKYCSIYICCMHMLEYVRLSENLERQILLQKDEERKLGLHLLQFAEAVEEACTNLLPNVLCEYLYDLYDKFLLRVPGCWVCCG